MPVIPAFRWQKQEDCSKFQTSQGYIARYYEQTSKTKHRSTHPILGCGGRVIGARSDRVTEDSVSKIITPTHIYIICKE